MYTDRDYQFAGVPQYMSGLWYIKTANDDKNLLSGISSNNIFISFTVNKPVKIFVGYDSRYDEIPEWLKEFQFRGDQIHHLNFKNRKETKI